MKGIPWCFVDDRYLEAVDTCGVIARSIHFFFFFFSSRRRHTRFDCDWSSDVCSSDLEFGCSCATEGIGANFLAPLLQSLHGSFGGNAFLLTRLLAFLNAAFKFFQDRKSVV